MKNTVKAGLYAAAGTSLVALNSMNSAYATASDTFGLNKTEVNGEQGELQSAVQGYINTFMTFLAIIAVLLILWGGFNILTAAGDDDKVSKGKTIIIQAGIGLLVIFLANSIITWVLGLFVSNAA
jgi:hypothetical protein